MAAVPVTIVGILTTDSGSTNATMVGMASLTGLGVGGGPVVPDGKPPGIWGGPIDPYPGHPLPEPPGKPEVPPPSVWPNPPEGTAPIVEHPIVLPPPGNAIPPGTLITWKAYWTPETGWVVLGHPNVPHPAPS